MLFYGCAVLSALFDRLREAHSRSDIKAIVVTGAKGKFSAGFDINEFVKQSGGGGIDSSYAALSGTEWHQWCLLSYCVTLTAQAATCA